MSTRSGNAKFQWPVVALDAALILLSIEFAAWLRPRLGFVEPVLPGLIEQLRLPLVLLWVVAIWACGGYRVREFGSGTREYRRVMLGSAALIGGLGVVLYLTETELSRAFYLVMAVMGPGCLVLGRFLARRVLHRLHTRDRLTTNVMVVGPVERTAELRRNLEQEPWLGLKVTVETQLDADRPEPAQLLPIVKEHDIDLILFTDGSVPDSTDFRRHIWAFEGQRVQLAVMPSLVDVTADRVRLRPVAGLPIVYVEGSRSQQALSSGKRVFDVIFASLALILLSPVLLLVGATVHASGGPALFSQVRIGRNGRRFKIYKFRTMRPGTEHELAGASDGDYADKLFKLRDDPRVTRIGRFLRRYSVDELPQLLNIVRGDMSLVGPRPPLPGEVDHYNRDELRRLRVRPGLTGLWQVSGRSNLDWAQTIRLDLYYIDNWSVLQDLAIIARTVKAVVTSEGAY